jgi:hypothetical protein
LVRSSGGAVGGVACDHMGDSSRTVFRVSIVGGVESSTKIRLGKLGAVEFGCRVNPGRRRLLVSMWNRANGDAAASVTESMTQCDGCAGMIFS